MERIDSLIQSKHLLKHPFYIAWDRGLLNREVLRDYAIQYYHHIKAFPRYLSAVHSHTEDAETRKHLLANLVEEEAGSPNHPELWRQFCLKLEGNPAAIETAAPITSIRNLIDTFLEMCTTGSPAEGIAALYAYESQIPEICISKIRGLKAHYGMHAPSDWEYFSVHIEADKEHREVERQLLEKLLESTPFEAIQKAASRILNALWAFLDEMVERHSICCVEIA